MNEYGWLFGGLGICVAAFVGLIIFAVVNDNQESAKWKEFSKSHDCHITQKMKGDASFGIGQIDGKMATVITPNPDREAWACNDGVTYWRDK